ncbi:MAG: hypothetical protein U1E62_07440 [Alsobacter sp.]
MSARLRSLCLVVLMVLGPALADEPPAAPAPVGPASDPASPREVEAYGEADVTCLEWSNGCQVCRRQPDGGWACSTPGIACVPEAVTCRGR